MGRSQKSYQTRGEENKMKRKMQIPESIKSILWSYDLTDVDVEENKEMIITQVLNYGTWEDVKTLLKVYGEAEIKEVVSHPKRGYWWRKVLNFWVTVLDIKISKKNFEKAVIKVKPEF